jgi:hypothetical protein
MGGLLYPPYNQETTHIKSEQWHFEAGDIVQFRNYTNSKCKWTFGKILEKESEWFTKLKWMMEVFGEDTLTNYWNMKVDAP